MTTANSGFFNHTKMALVDNPSILIKNAEYNESILEKIGSFLSWHVTKLPSKAYHALRDPKVITVALTSIAMLSVQFAFYPRISILAAKSLATFIAKQIPAWTVKASAYTIIQAAILGLGTRALGRFSNNELMQKWYSNS
jgi:hypothetical protein